LNPTLTSSVIKQLLSHNDFSKNTHGAQLDTNAVFLLANCYLTGALREVEHMNLGVALLGFLEHHCTVHHAAAVFGLDGAVYARPASMNDCSDELYIQMPGPCEINCTAGFRSLALLKKVFQHALASLTTGKPLHHVLSLHKYKLFVAVGHNERFAPSDNLYIGGIPSTASEADVSAMIESVLNRLPLRVTIRQKSPQGLKHSFVWVGDVEDAAFCIKALSGIFFGGRRLMVNFAAPSKIDRPSDAVTDQKRQHIQHFGFEQQFCGCEPSFRVYPTPAISDAMQNYYEEKACFFPPVAPSFPMVMVPLYGVYPTRPGCPVAQMPFCMPPPEPSNLYIVAECCFEFKGEYNDINDGRSHSISSEGTYTSDDGSESTSVGPSSKDDIDKEANINFNAEKRSTNNASAVDETGTAALKELMGICARNLISTCEERGDWGFGNFVF
jgi:hypothetical protein